LLGSQLVFTVHLGSTRLNETVASSDDVGFPQPTGERNPIIRSIRRSISPPRLRSAARSLTGSIAADLSNVCFINGSHLRDI
jgi:hypothetical protein